MLRVCELHFLSGVQVDKRARCQLHTGLIRRIYLHIRGKHFAKRHLVRLIRLLDKHCEHRGDHRGCQLCVRKTPKLFQAFQHRCQQWYAAQLTGTFALHQTENILPPGLFAVGFHSCPVRGRQSRHAGRRQRVPVANPVRNDHAVCIGFNTLHDLFNMMLVNVRRRKDVHKRRRTNAVGFDDPHTQVIRYTGRLFVLQDCP